MYVEAGNVAGTCGNGGTAWPGLSAQLPGGGREEGVGGASAVSDPAPRPRADTTPSKDPDCPGGWVVGTVWAQNTGLVSLLQGLYANTGTATAAVTYV